METLEDLRPPDVATAATPPSHSRQMPAFLLGVFLLSGATLQYEVVLTRLMSVVSWYYLAFVSVSMAMFGMTAGALAVQLLENHFAEDVRGRRLTQSALAMAVSLPLSMLTMFAIPLGEVTSVQGIYTLLLFTAVISIPFFFAGVVVCLALTRSPYPIGRVYAIDLIGAAAGCLGAIALMQLVDAPSAVLVVSGFVFASAALFAFSAREHALLRKAALLAIAMLVLAAVNATSESPIRPLWVKFGLDKRAGIEVWNPISRVRVYWPVIDQPYMWGASPKTPDLKVKWMWLDIDSDAASSIIENRGDPQALQFLNYDVTSVAYQLRPGGTAAVIGIGGGRDLLTAWTNGFQRIVGVEINPSLIDLTTNKLKSFSGLPLIPGLEIHKDEGRSFLTRSAERFDVIQASMVDTWAATSAGSMSLTENSLYTVEAWKIFYEHLKPAGMLTVTRWNMGIESAQTVRMFSVAWATLLSEGVANPRDHVALIGSRRVATILLTNRPFSPDDEKNLKKICDDLQFRILFLKDSSSPQLPQLPVIAATHTLPELTRATSGAVFDISPVYDRSPFFFNSLHLRNLLFHGDQPIEGGNLLALSFLLSYMLAAVLLLGLAVFWPLRHWYKSRNTRSPWRPRRHRLFSRHRPRLHARRSRHDRAAIPAPRPSHLFARRRSRRTHSLHRHRQHGLRSLPRPHLAHLPHPRAGRSRSRSRLRLRRPPANPRRRRAGPLAKNRPGPRAPLPLRLLNGLLLPHRHARPARRRQLRNVALDVGPQRRRLRRRRLPRRHPLNGSQHHNLLPRRRRLLRRRRPPPPARPLGHLSGSRARLKLFLKCRVSLQSRFGIQNRLASLKFACFRDLSGRPR